MLRAFSIVVLVACHHLKAVTSLQEDKNRDHPSTPAEVQQLMAFDELMLQSEGDALRSAEDAEDVYWNASALEVKNQDTIINLMHL